MAAMYTIKFPLASQGIKNSTGGLSPLGHSFRHCSRRQQQKAIILRANQSFGWHRDNNSSSS